MNIDVHIIKNDRGYLDECLESLEGSPINLHFVDYVDGNHGKARIKGFMQGHSPYVSCFDDDDIAVPTVFERALRVMEKGYTAYYSNHYYLDENRQVKGKRFGKIAAKPGMGQAAQMHHVVVYRRDVILPVLHLLDGIYASDQLLLNLKAIYDGKVLGDPFMGMYWRIHEHNLHKRKTFNNKNNPKEWQDAVEYYKNEIQKRND